MESTTTLKKSVFVKILFIILGWLCFITGCIGIIIPGLPTLDFWMLAAICWAKSSTRLHDWLMQNKYFGNYLSNMKERKGIPLKAKIISISFLWISITYSIIKLKDNKWIVYSLFFIAVGVTFFLIFFPTLKNEKVIENQNIKS